MNSNRNRTDHDPMFLHRHGLAVAICTALAASAAQAADFPVTSSADSGAGSLRDAIAQANANAGPDSISFADVDSITLTSGQIDVTDELTVNGPVDGVVISGNDNSRIFGVTQQGVSLEINRAVLTNGRTSDTGGMGDCTAGTRNGGAICSVGPLRLSESRILASEASDSRGGAIWLATISGLVDFEDCEISGNQSFDQGGAAAIQATTLDIRNCTISENATVDNSSYGGALYVDTDGTVIENTTFSSNQTLAQNGDGGALWQRGDAEIINSTFSNNVATGDFASGAAIFSREGNLTLRSVTITDNESTGGAVGFTDNTPRSFDMISTILAGNTGPEGNLLAFADADGAITVNVEASLFGDDPNEIDGLDIDNVFDDDPQLGPLTDNGCGLIAGVTGTGILPPAACVQTHEPLSGSPAIDAGENAFEPTDQRGSGFPRTVLSGVDIGAIEFDGVDSGPTIPEAVPIPTLSNWTLGLLAWLIGGIGVTMSSRRRRELAER